MSDSTAQKIVNWKALDEREELDDPALEFPPKDDPKADNANGADKVDKADKADKAEKPRKPRKPAVPKAKRQSATNTGWFIECYPVRKDSDGKPVADLGGLTVFGPIANAKNERDVMPHLRALAGTDPESVANHVVRIVKVAAVMNPKVRQVVDFD